MTLQCQEEVSPGLTVTVVHKTALHTLSGISRILRGQGQMPASVTEQTTAEEFEAYTPFQKGNLDIEKLLKN